ncbi:MAG: T9SS type A sorting domain-containing protein [candidate division KSB1 bacterium]|nr:T9SS type A sorting domain-containing protein [candidate division KSB1 bacterium]
MLFLAAALLWLPFIARGQPKHFKFTANTGANYVILIRTAMINHTPLNPGDEIGVFTSAGLCVGASEVKTISNLSVVAWQDDPLTSETDGFADSDTMHFRFWHNETQTELEAAAVYLDGFGNGTFGFGAYSYVDLRAAFNFPPRIFLSNVIAFDEDTVFELLLDTAVHDANDADSLLQWQIHCGPNLTSVITVQRLLRLLPAPDWFGTEACTFIVTDPAGASDTLIVELRVRAVNDVPALRLPPLVTIAEDDTTTVLALDTLVADAESPDSVLAWTVTPDPNIAVRFEAFSRLLRLVPAPNFNGQGRIGLSVKDPEGGEARGDLVVIVTPVPDSPTAAVLVSPVRGATVGTLNPVLRWQAATDADGDELSYTVRYSTSPMLTPAMMAETPTTFFKIPTPLQAGTRYFWQVTVSDGILPGVASSIDSFFTAHDATPDTTVKVEQIATLPSQFILQQNFPNPISLAAGEMATFIRLSLPQPVAISLRIYNSLGQLVRELFHGAKAAGLHQLVWDGRDANGRRVGSGLYWLRLESKAFVAAKKIVVIP